MERWFSRINEGFALLGAVLLLMMMFSISYGALTRSLGLPSPIWIVQVNEYNLVWVCFLATAWVLSVNKHVRVDILMSRFGRKGQNVLLFIQDVVSTLLCAVFCYLCSLSTWEHFREKVMDVGSIDVPKGWVLIVIPMGFLLLTLQFFIRALRDIRRFSTGGGPGGALTGGEGAAAPAEKGG
jgi:TRAP-type C4-dicarboxylate transport system permease small subunit